MSGRTIHWAKPELVAGFEMTSWTNDGVIRQASLQEVRERADKIFGLIGPTCRNQACAQRWPARPVDQRTLTQQHGGEDAS
jgi:hypothetical protein